MLIAYGVYTPMLKKQIEVAIQEGTGSAEYRQFARRSGMVGQLMGVMALGLIVFKP